MADNSYRLGVAQAIIAGVFLSTAGIGMRLLDHASALQVTFYRALGLAFFLFVVLGVKYRAGLLPALLSVGKIGFFAALAFASASWCIIFAFDHTTVANVMFIVSLAPCFAALMAWVLLRERVTIRTWIAIAIALTGIFVMIDGALSTEGITGILYAFGMAVSYGLFTVLARMGKSRDMLPAVFWSGILLAAVCAIPMTEFTLGFKDTTICLFLGIFQIGLGGFLLVLAAKSVPAAQIVFLAMLEVVLSPLWVWLIVDEVPTKSTLVGGAIIILAITYLALDTQQQTSVVSK